LKVEGGFLNFREMKEFCGLWAAGLRLWAGRPAYGPPGP
jgi:hypothetical protein